MATASDNFDRADSSTLGANWTEPTTGTSNSFAIVSNQAQTPASTGTGALWSATTFTATQFSKVTFVNIASTYQMVTVRHASGVETYYAGGRNSSDFVDSKYHIWKVVSGTNTSLAVTASQVAAAGDVVELDVSGTNLTLIVNGITILTVSDSAIASGQPGMVARHSAALVVFDDWSGGDGTSGAGGSIALDGPPYGPRGVQQQVAQGWV
jgi:hypothetical protein